MIPTLTPTTFTSRTPARQQVNFSAHGKARKGRFNGYSTMPMATSAPLPTKPFNYTRQQMRWHV